MPFHPTVTMTGHEETAFDNIIITAIMWMKRHGCPSNDKLKWFCYDSTERKKIILMLSFTAGWEFCIDGLNSIRPATETNRNC